MHKEDYTLKNIIYYPLKTIINLVSEVCAVISDWIGLASQPNV